MQEIEKLLNLEQYKILKVEERKEEKKVKKIIYVESKKKKCPICGMLKSILKCKIWTI